MNLIVMVVVKCSIPVFMFLFLWINTSGHNIFTSYNQFQILGVTSHLSCKHTHLVKRIDSLVMSVFLIHFMLENFFSHKTTSQELLSRLHVVVTS